MNYHIQYNKPERTDICVAYAFFNPCGYVRPLQNLVFFENKLRLANIPYFSAEMIVGDQQPMLSNPTCVYKSKSYLFYKEELFNKLEKLIPAQYTKIMFLDTDIIFNCTDWVDRLSRMLDTNDIVQVFERVCYLDLTYNENHWMNASTVDYNVSGSGFGWAMTRSFLHRIGGFFDKCTLGSGDSIFFHSIVNRPVMKYPVIQSFINEYREKIAGLNPKWSFLPGVNIYHLTHGSRINRRYADRYGILTRSDFTWDSLFYKNDDGFWELKDENINAEFFQYFKNRSEDSICAFTTIGAVPPKQLNTKGSANHKSSSKGHSGPHMAPKKLDQPTKKVQIAQPQVWQPSHHVQPIIHRSQPKSQAKPHQSAHIQGAVIESKVKPIPRYLAPQVNIQKQIHTHSSASQAAAVKSLEQRASIRNTVVYNRTPVQIHSRRYDSDDDYSD
jgi:hypothetical protein